MPQTSELNALYRVLDQLRNEVGDLHRRYGDIPAVLRLVGDLDRLKLDAHDLDAIPVPLDRPGPMIEYISDEPVDTSTWADVDDEGVGGYHGSRKR